MLANNTARLYWRRHARDHRIQKFRPVLSPTARSTWGRLKHLYR